MKKGLFIIFIFGAFYCKSQQSYNLLDTFPFFFELGSFELKEKDIKVIDSIAINIDHKCLKEIRITGYSDTLGGSESNDSIVRNRTKYANLKFKSTLNNIQHKQIKTYYKPESEIHKSLDSNRRLDIIVKMNNQELCNTKEKILCYKVAFETINKSAVINDKSGIKIIIDPKDILDSTYLRTRKIKSNKFHVKLKDSLIWTTETIGKFRFKKEVLAATIPKASYKNARIIIADSGCVDSCSTNDLKSYMKQRQYDKKIQVDWFLMNHIQVKRIVFSQNKFRIRALKELINPKNKYYKDCEKRKRIQWRNGKLLWRKNYTYTKLNALNSRLENISKEIEICKPDILRGCKSKIIKICDFRLAIDSSFKAQIFSGYSSLDTTFYFGLGTNFFSILGQSFIHGGLTYNSQPYFNASQQFSLYSFPARDFFPFPMWQSPQEANLIYTVASIYIGAEMKQTWKKEINSYYSLKLGLDVANYKSKSIIPHRYFSALELGYLVKHENWKPSFQFGISWKLFKL